MECDGSLMFKVADKIKLRKLELLKWSRQQQEESNTQGRNRGVERTKW